MSRWYYCGRAAHPKTVYGPARVRCMRSMNERLVLVPASILADLVEMSELAAGQIDDAVLRDAVKGAVAMLRVEATFEP